MKQKFLDIARSQIGIREGRNANGSWNNRVKYNDWYVQTTGQTVYRDAAWCAIFVSWCANAAGIPTSIIPRHAWTPSGIDWFRSRGQQVSTPQPGDLMYVYYPSQGMVGHVGIVEKVEGNYVVTIEGNTNTSGSSQGNGVYRLRRKITSYLRFGRPKYDSAGSTAPSVTLKVPNPNKLKLVNKVSVANLKKARETEPQKKGTPVGPNADEVYTMEVALAKTGWMPAAQVDGHFGTATVSGTTGFQRKHSGTQKPDGWLGKKELTRLFQLAKMNVTVVD